MANLNKQDSINYAILFIELLVLSRISMILFNLRNHQAQYLCEDLLC